MGLVPKTRAGVEFGTLWKQRPDRGVRLAFRVRFLHGWQDHIEQVIHHSAVQTSYGLVSAGPSDGIDVLRDLNSIFFSHSDELLKSELYGLNSGLRRQVKTIAEIDHGTDN